MLDILISIGASMITGRIVTNVAEALGVPKPIAVGLGNIAGRLAGSEVGHLGDTPAHHGQPSPSLLHDTGPFAELRRHRAG